jgi:site-specific recombinase
MFPIFYPIYSSGGSGLELNPTWGGILLCLVILVIWFVFIPFVAMKLLNKRPHKAQIEFFEITCEWTLITCIAGLFVLFATLIAGALGI